MNVNGRNWNSTEDAMEMTANAKIDLCRDGMMDVAEAQSFSGLRRSTLYKLMEQGSLPYSKIGRCRRIPRQALVQLAARTLTGGWAVPENEPSK